MSRHGRELITEHGDDAPIEWVHRSQRYGEKLATPDTSIADLIGEVDPIKVAEGRYLSDELTLHYGLVPRTNRGIFAINELPDLAERIQVGLLNVLEERDIQVRGYKISLPARPRSSSPRPTPRTTRTAAGSSRRSRTASVRRSAPTTRSRCRRRSRSRWPRPHRWSADGVRVTVPDYMTEIVATLSHLARSSPHINQRSGVSVRFTITNHEVMVANAARRALRHGEKDVAPARQRPRGAARVDDGQDRDRVARGGPRRADRGEPREGGGAHGVQGAVHARAVPTDRHHVRRGRRHPRRRGRHVGRVRRPARAAARPPRAAVTELTGGDESAASVASAVELLLEGLHLSKRLNKDAVGARATYRARA